MLLEAVIEVTSYDVSSTKLLDYIKIPDGCRAVTLPCTTPDGLPNHVQVLVLKNGNKPCRRISICQ